jgi:hypothetical protein
MSEQFCRANEESALSEERFRLLIRHDACQWKGKQKESRTQHPDSSSRARSPWGEVSVDPVRLLEGFGQAVASVEGYQPAHEALKEALELTAPPADPKLVARVVTVRSIAGRELME